MRMISEWNIPRPTWKAALAVVVLAAASPIVAGVGPVQAATYSETTGGPTNTWTNPANAGGAQGQTIPAFTTVQISCKVQGFRVQDGNTNWYKIASSPWNGNFYASADAFYNNGATSGSLQGTPFVDPAVPDCGAVTPPPPPPPPPSTYAETTGGATNTWSNPANAGGAQGQTIPAFTTVQVSCKVQGFRVADGNTNWYRIASSPWSNQFYASADAFYNNGATSGSLRGTPFVDPTVPTCAGSITPPGGTNPGGGTPGGGGNPGGGGGSSPMVVSSAFYSPIRGIGSPYSNDDGRSYFNGPATAHWDFIPATWQGGSSCQTAGAINVLRPAQVKTLSGWSVGRLGPIYVLTDPGYRSTVRNVVLFDPGNSSEMAQGCDAKLDVNGILANWLKSNPANRLLVLTGGVSEERTWYGRSTFAGLWKYYFAGIWNQPFANQALVCDYNLLSHYNVLAKFRWVAQNPPTSCPTAAGAPNPVAWHP